MAHVVTEGDRLIPTMLVVLSKFDIFCTSIFLKKIGIFGIAQLCFDMEPFGPLHHIPISCGKLFCLWRPIGRFFGVLQAGPASAGRKFA